MNFSLRSAVVGVGYLGRFHAQKHKSLGTLKFVCDVSASRAQEVAAELSCEALSDPRSLVGKVDAVTVAADTRNHFELCQFFLENNVHVLVEKPICATVEEAEKIVALAEKKKLGLAVGHVERFNPAFSAALKYVNKAKFVQLLRLAPFKPRSLSVDVVLDLMIHDLDLATTLTNSKITEIRAKGSRVITDFNDACDAWLGFENGAEAYLSCNRVDQKTLRTINVYDSDGILQIDLGGQSLQRLKQAAGVSSTPLEVQPLAVEKWDAILKETESFFLAIQTNSEALVTGRQGLEALRSAEKILELTR